MAPVAVGPCSQTGDAIAVGQLGPVTAIGGGPPLRLAWRSAGTSSRRAWLKAGQLRSVTWPGRATSIAPADVVYGCLVVDGWQQPHRGPIHAAA